MSLALGLADNGAVWPHALCAGQRGGKETETAATNGLKRAKRRGQGVALPPHKADTRAKNSVRNVYFNVHYHDALHVPRV